MNDNCLLDFFQSGFYQEFWGWEFNRGESEETAEQIISLLEISRGHILDWCGGWGRISLPLAERGFDITILDFVPAYLARAEEEFKKSGVPVKTVAADSRNTPETIQADYAICTFNSIGFLTDEQQLEAFRSLHGALKEGAKILIDCTNLLYVIKNFMSTMENRRPDGMRCLSHYTLDAARNILAADFKLLDPDGTCTAEKKILQRLYSPLELQNMLISAGFKVNKMYGSYTKEELSFDLPQIICIAEK